MYNLDYKNMKFKQLINDIIIDIWSYKNFASMGNIKWKFNSMVKLSEFTYNQKILSKFVAKFCPKAKDMFGNYFFLFFLCVFLKIVFYFLGKKTCLVTQNK